MKIEMLYPEVANLHGDNFNITYLTKCRPDADVVSTPLNGEPAFVHSTPDLIYLGPMSETSQLWVIDRLMPYKTRIEELIDAGTVFLFTHNAMEVLGERIVNKAQGYDKPGLGIFPMRTTINLDGRYNGKVMGTYKGFTVVGYKSQFSMVEADDSLPGFVVAEQGVGRNTYTQVEGVRRNNFIGTSLIGPLLIMNPLLTADILATIDPETEPRLAFEDLAMAAYQARLEDFHDPKRWHPRETPLRKPV